MLDQRVGPRLKVGAVVCDLDVEIPQELIDENPSALLVGSRLPRVEGLFQSLMARPEEVDLILHGLMRPDGCPAILDRDVLTCSTSRPCRLSSRGTSRESDRASGVGPFFDEGQQAIEIEWLR